MSGEVTGRKCTGNKVCWLCQYFPDTRQRSVANLAMMHRRLVAWEFIFLFLALLLSFTGCGWFEGEEFPTETAIEKIESTTEFGRKVYHITCSDKENIEYMLSVIVLKGSKKGRLQFYNQRDLEWNKMDLNKEES
jgi:hypothetical protein